MQQLAFELALARRGDDALGDIVHGAEDPHGAAIIAKMHIDLAAQYALLTVRADDAEFEQVGIRFSHALPRLDVSLAVFGMDISQRRLPGGRLLAFFDAEDGVHLIRPCNPAGLQIVIKAAHIRDLLRTRHALAALQQLDLGLLALGDILQRAEEADGPFLGVERDRAFAADDAFDAVRTGNAVFERRHRLAQELVRPRIPEALAIVRMDQFDELRGTPGGPDLQAHDPIHFIGPFAVAGD